MPCDPLGGACGLQQGKRVCRAQSSGSLCGSPSVGPFPSPCTSSRLLPETGGGQLRHHKQGSLHARARGSPGMSFNLHGPEGTACVPSHLRISAQASPLHAHTLRLHARQPDLAHLILSCPQGLSPPTGDKASLVA